MTTPAEGLARLRTAAESGVLDALCAERSVRVLTVFGSAARDEPAARDLDVAVISGAMTPRTIDWRSVRAKLRRIRELLDQLQAFGPVDARRLTAEPVTELATERVLTLLVDLAFACNSHVATRDPRPGS